MEKRLCIKCWEERDFKPEPVEVTKMHKGVEVTYTKYYANCPVCGEGIYDAEMHDKNIENLVNAYKAKVETMKSQSAE